MLKKMARNTAIFLLKGCWFYFLFCPLSHSGFSEFLLQQKINDIEKKAHVTMGVTAILIEKNKVITHNGDKRFFMASTIKVPIAIAFLQRVDEKRDTLSRLITMSPLNSVPGSGSLYHLFEKKQLNISLLQILTHMLISSDNSASDALLNIINGPQYVAKRMAALGFKNILINRSILQMFMDTNDVPHIHRGTHNTVFLWKKIFTTTPLSKKVLAWKRFENDIRDSTTPHDMAQLLVKLYRNEILSKTSTQLLLGIMERCRTGRSRIKGLLPPHVRVAHKTGTWAIDELNYLRYPGANQLFRFASDVGIITLPYNKGACCYRDICKITKRQ